MEFVYNNVFEPNSTDFTSSKLQKIPKMLNDITQYNILPRKGSYDIVTKNDLMVLYHILFGERLNLTYVLIQHMISTTQSSKRQLCVPYGILLTKVFQKFLVSLEDEKFLLIIKKFRPKNVIHMKESPDDTKNVSRKGMAVMLENQLLKIFYFHIALKDNLPFWKNMGLCFQISRLRLPLWIKPPMCYKAL